MQKHSSSVPFNSPSLFNFLRSIIIVPSFSLNLSALVMVKKLWMDAKSSSRQMYELLGLSRIFNECSSLELFVYRTLNDWIAISLELFQFPLWCMIEHQIHEPLIWFGMYWIYHILTLPNHLKYSQLRFSTLGLNCLWRWSISYILRNRPI